MEQDLHTKEMAINRVKSCTRSILWKFLLWRWLNQPIPFQETIIAKLRFDANKPIDFIVCSKKDKSLFLEVDDSSPEFYSQYSLDDERILCHYQIALSGIEQQILSKRLKSVINAKGGFYHE